MIDLLLPFQYEFFIKGIVVSVLLGGICGLAGVYIILRGLSYVGHGLSHAAFGGAIVGNIVGINYYIGVKALKSLMAVLHLLQSCYT